jgi:alpha-tubulin suppressor-like RCC1 family protein
LPQLIKNINFAHIDTKKSISAGVTIDGKLYTWGRNRNGIIGHLPPNLNVLLPREVEIDDKIVQVSCGY